MLLNQGQASEKSLYVKLEHPAAAIQRMKKKASRPSWVHMCQGRKRGIGFGAVEKMNQKRVSIVRTAWRMLVGFGDREMDRGSYDGDVEADFGGGFAIDGVEV
jgi:hypothetical protein